MKPLRPLVGRRIIYHHVACYSRPFATSRSVRQYQNPRPDPSPQTGPDQPDVSEDEPRKGKDDGPGWKSTAWKMFESASTTFASLAVLGAAGYGYHLYYKALVLRKISLAFDPGDPVLDLAAPTPSAKDAVNVQDGDVEKDDVTKVWFEQPEQKTIDAIMSGQKKGRYYLLVGEKGTGKSSMLIEAMRKVDGDGISMLDAHADLEIFRIRLGKALNYEFHEASLSKQPTPVWSYIDRRGT